MISIIIDYCFSFFRDISKDVAWYRGLNVLRKAWPSCGTEVKIQVCNGSQSLSVALDSWLWCTKEAIVRLWHRNHGSGVGQELWPWCSEEAIVLMWQGVMVLGCKGLIDMVWYRNYGFPKFFSFLLLIKNFQRPEFLHWLYFQKSYWSFFLYTNRSVIYSKTAKLTHILTSIFVSHIQWWTGSMLLSVILDLCQ